MSIIKRHHSSSILFGYLVFKSSIRKGMLRMMQSPQLWHPEERKCVQAESVRSLKCIWTLMKYTHPIPLLENDQTPNYKVEKSTTWWRYKGAVEAYHLHPISMHTVHMGCFPYYVPCVSLSTGLNLFGVIVSSHIHLVDFADAFIQIFTHRGWNQPRRAIASSEFWSI